MIGNNFKWNHAQTVRFNQIKKRYFSPESKSKPIDDQPKSKAVVHRLPVFKSEHRKSPFAKGKSMHATLQLLN